MLVNPQKYTTLRIKGPVNHSCSNSVLFEAKQHVNILGFILNNELSWKEQISSVFSRISKRLHVIRILKKTVIVNDLKAICRALITSLLMRGSTVYGRLNRDLLSKLQRLRKRSRIICGAGCSCPDLQPTEKRFNEAACNFLLKFENHVTHPLHGRVPKRSKRIFFLYINRKHVFFPVASLLHNKRL